MAWDDRNVNINEQAFTYTISCLSVPSLDQTSHSSATVTDYAPQFLSSLISGGLYGREVEQTKLRNIYDSVCTGPSQVVFVSGESGIGKSSLVESLRDYVAGDGRQGYFVSGKYDQIGFLEPFSALVAAFSDLVTLIQQSEESDQFQERIYNLVGEDIMILSNVIPGLVPITSNQETSSTTMENAFSQFKALCRSFLQSVSSPSHPILIFLDDLQWCDEASVKVIRSLLSDLDSKHILLVITLRDDEDGPRIQSQILDSEKTWPTTNIVVGLLNVAIVSNMLHCVSGRDVNSCQELAQILVNKTNGNIYFLLQFLRRMEDENIVRFVPTSRSWNWDVDHILATTNVAENVADIVATRLKRLSHKVLEVLKIAAALGYEFDFDVLHNIALSEGVLEGKESRTELSVIVTKCLNDGFLERCKGNKYKHSHDRTQTCLYSSIGPPVTISALHMRIGIVLDSMTQSYPDLSLIFLATDQWNRGRCHISEPQHIERLRKLNLIAGKESMSKQSFHHAVNYFEMYLSLIEDENQNWTTYYEESIDLFGLYASALHNCGAFEKCIAVSEIIIHNGTSVLHKIPGFMALSSSLSAQGKNVDATNVCHFALTLLGERIPRKPSIFHVLAEILKVRRALQGKTDEEILSFPRMSNKKKIAAMHLLDRIAVQVSMNYSERNMFVLVSHRMAYLSCKYGLTTKSPLGFAFYASILAFSHRQQAFRYGELAVRMIELLSARECECRTITILYGLVFHWRDSFWQTFEGFTKAYHSGMAMGDSEAAFVASFGFLGFAFFGSPTLLHNEAEIRSLCNVLEDLPHELPSLIVHPCLQITLNMMGVSNNRISLNSVNFDERLWEERLKKQNNPMLTHFMFLAKLQMAYFFDGATEMKQELKRVDRHLLVIRQSFLQYVGRFFCGIAYFALYRLLQKGKYLRRGVQLCSIFRKYVLSGVKNCDGYYLLLDALRVSATKRHIDSEIAFERAITFGRDNRSVIFQAMCYESAAEMIFPLDKLAAREYFMNSISLWRQWNAIAKVEHITEKIDLLFPDSPMRDIADFPLEITRQHIGAENVATESFDRDDVSDIQ